MKRLKITTAEIAKICEVSQGTVDRALNNRPDIKAETKNKILQVARHYGYREQVSQKDDGMRSLVGIIVFNLNNWYFSNLITELEYVFNEERIGTIVMMSHYDKRRETECIRNLYNMGVKSIIICPVNSGKEFENYLSIFDLPIICVGNRVGTLPYVGVDDFKAMKEMTFNCLREDYERIIYFSPALSYSDAPAQRLRYEGFLNAMGGRDFECVTDICNIKEHYGEKTVIICSNDHYALKVYFRGVNAKITGFDNVKTISDYKIPITTVGCNASEIALSVAEIVLGKSNTTKIINHYIV